MKTSFKLCVTACLGMIFPQAVSAWENHGVLMPWIVLEAQNTTPAFAQALKSPYPSVPFENQLDRYDFFSQILLLNPDAKWDSNRAQNFTDVMLLAVDDPDQGMDRNLPDSADPSNERKYMGGSTGPSSQGFRHMYFGGWDWRRPFSSFQIPIRPIGQSPDRLDLLANEAKKLIQSGDLMWGLRILAWSIHYAQDLTQPFHVVQIPSFKIVPWEALLQWPPQAGFETLVKESTRTIGNYHRAFETEVRSELGKREGSRFHDCLTAPSVSLMHETPREMALSLVRESQKRARELGNATYEYFGQQLMQPEFDLIKNSEKIPPVQIAARKKIDELTCDSLRLAKASSLWLIRWAFSR